MCVRFEYARVLRNGSFAALLGLLTALVPVVSHADICTDLRAQLRGAAPAVSSPAQQKRYASAARRQAAEIQKVVRQQRAQKCAFNPSASCQQINLTIRSMKGNLAQLEARRDQLGGRGDRRNVRAIEAKLKANRCNQPQRIARRNDSSASRRTTSVVVREGVGRREIVRTTVHSVPSQNANSIFVPQALGSFRTMCVRTCDGYYFPVSVSSGTGSFARDEKVCAAMCPAAKTRLYYHSVPDQESDAMVSLHGEPYTALPTAFLYRQFGLSRRNSQCSCGKPQMTSISNDRDLEATYATSIPVPLARPDWRSDADAQLEAANALAKQELRDVTDGIQTGEIVANAAERKVRVVGPEFLPAPEEAIDLRSPARTNGL
jgi:hypothetical protein